MTSANQTSPQYDSIGKRKPAVVGPPDTARGASDSVTTSNHAKTHRRPSTEVSRASVAFEDWWSSYSFKDLTSKKTAWYAWVAAITWAAPHAKRPWVGVPTDNEVKPT